MVSLTVNTAEHPVHQRAEVWRHAVSEAFVPLTVVPGDPESFSASLSARRIGSLQVCDVTAEAHVARRTTRLVDRAGGDFYKLGVGVTGSCVVRQDGRESVIGPGSVMLYDTTRPYDVVVPERHRVVVMMFPRHALDLPARRVGALTASTLPGSTPLGALVTPFLVKLAHTELAGQAAARLAAGALDLVGALLAERLDVAHPADEDLLWERICRYAQAHLGNPDLGPEALAAAHHISVRHLQRLFQRQATTISGWLRTRRLDQVRADLLDPALRDRPIWALAVRAGFTDPAHFSRAFRAAYGISPRAYRASAKD